MYAATGGVNTQKGLLFSLGILCCAIGLLHGRGVPPTDTAIRECVRRICEGIVAKELETLRPAKADTAGRKVFLEYGILGIRGEAEKGFPAVFELGLPFLRKRVERPVSGEAFIDLLLELMLVVDDTNVVSRGGLGALTLVRELAAEALALGGIAAAAGRRRIMAMDRRLRHLGISPGGCADMLAATIFLYLFSNEVDKFRR